MQNSQDLLDAPSHCLQDARQRLGKVVGDRFWKPHVISLDDLEGFSKLLLQSDETIHFDAEYRRISKRAAAWVRTKCNMPFLRRPLHLPGLRDQLCQGKLGGSEHDGHDG